MGVIAVFSIIGFVGCIFGAIFSKSRLACLITAAILAMMATAGLWMEDYSGKHPKITVETYKAFTIDFYDSSVKFDDPVLVKKTTTEYTLASVFHTGNTVYEVTLLEK